jgi:hypothetical protein
MPFLLSSEAIKVVFQGSIESLKSICNEYDKGITTPCDQNLRSVVTDSGYGTIKNER